VASIVRSFSGRRRVLAAALIGAVVLAVGSARSDLALGQSDEYTLYYSLDVPPVITGIALTDEGEKRSYNGTLRGTLGGLPVAESKYSFTTGASPKAGGGTFSMATKAGSVKDGRVLMTSDGKQTMLLFVGQYLGASLSFSLTGASTQLGGGATNASGLAETNFRSHEEYVTAVRNAAAALAPAEREQVVAQADQNLRLVRDYQHRSPPR
jgi:hypothetical protein